MVEMIKPDAVWMPGDLTYDCTSCGGECPEPALQCPCCDEPICSAQCREGLERSHAALRATDTAGFWQQVDARCQGSE